MSQITTGLRAALSNPILYEGFQSAIGAHSYRKTIVEEYLAVRPGERVLDVGCGPAHLLEFMPDVQYVGIDLSPSYIAHAKHNFGDRGQFFLGDVAELETHQTEPFDLVVAVGLLHHLDDDDVLSLMRALNRNVARPNGRIVTVDGCYDDSQSRLAALILSWDRGRNVRTIDGYTKLMRTSFPETRASIRHDMLRIPYTICVIESKP